MDNPASLQRLGSSSATPTSPPRDPNISEMVQHLHQRVGSMQEVAGLMDEIAVRLLGVQPEPGGTGSTAVPVPNTVEASLRALTESFSITEGRMRMTLARLDRGV